MHIDWWTLALQTINLLVLVWILSRFLFRPIADIIRQRQTAADELLQKAEAEEARAEQEEEEARKDKEEAEKSRGGVLQAAVKEAEAEKQQLLASAREEADNLRAAAKAEVAKLREAEDARASEQAGRLAVEIAGKLFDRLPDSARIDGFIDGLADAARKLPEQARAEIGAGGTPATLVAARQMTDAELATCEDTLSKALGRKLRLVAKADPDLIAGLEIETSHAAVRNSFRADLERITAELSSNG